MSPLCYVGNQIHAKHEFRGLSHTCARCLLTLTDGLFTQPETAGGEEPKEVMMNQITQLEFPFTTSENNLTSGS